MSKVMVWNFKTEQYEQATEAEGKELLGLIESMNAECAAQQTGAVDVACACGSKRFYNKNDARYCIRCDAIQPRN